MKIENTMSSVQDFKKAIPRIRDIFRKNGITGMDSMRHASLYLLSRFLTLERCKELKIDNKFGWETIMNSTDESKNIPLELFGTGEDCLLTQFDKLFGTQTFTFDMKDPISHYQILEILNKVNVNNVELHMDVLGYVYEDHLKNGSSNARDLGQFFTDRTVCDYMVKLCNPTCKRKGVPESVCDPSMGTGGFLTAYMKHFNNSVNWKNQQKQIHGWDHDNKVTGFARLNLFMESKGIPFDNLYCEDSLKNGIRTSYDIILANMPFGLKGLKFADCHESVKKLKIDGTKSEPLFLQLMMSSMNDGGRCAVVVPDGVLVNNSKQHNGTRKYLIENFNLKRVIKITGKIFTNTGIRPSILFFEKNGHTETVEFWEIEKNADDTIKETLIISVPRSKFDDACSLDMRRYQEISVVANTGGYPMVKLGDIVEFKNGKNIPERDRNETGTYPYYASNGISGFVEKSIFEGPSVLLGDQGSAWHKSHHFVENGVKFYAGNHTIVMKPKNTSLDIKYLYYHLLLNDLQNFNKCAALIPELDKERFYSSNMILPPLPIQQEIVTALDLIYNNAATAKAAAVSVKSQMAAVVRSVGARGFEHKHIKDVMNVVSGKANQDREAGRPVPYYDSNGVIGYVVEPLYTGEYTITARNLSIGAVHYINGPFYPSDHTINFTSLNQNVMNNRFFYYWLHLNNQVLKELSSGIKPGIRKSDVAEILMPVPPIQFQHEILAILNEMEAELATLEQMAAKAEQRAKFILDGYTC